jgi:hypothetical protein
MDILEIAVLITVGAIALFVGWWLWPVRNTRLMRCPDTGAIACVHVIHVRRDEATPPAPRVRFCDLWPLRRPCARGCLARYNETVPRSRVNVEALRPFEHP